jgi:hypothetical protein
LGQRRPIQIAMVFEPGAANEQEDERDHKSLLRLRENKKIKKMFH